MKTIKIGSRVSFTSKAHSGKGVVDELRKGPTGDWVTVKTKDHPTGRVTVRRSQVA